MKSDQLKSAPLKTCLIQAIFSPLLNIKSFIPEIQESLRRNGFPQLKTGKNKTVTFNKSIDDPVIEEDDNWFFISLDNKDMVIINKTQFSFQTNAYTTFEAFITKYQTLLSIFFPIVDASSLVMQRLGLRYINVLKGEGWKDYLKSPYHGVSISDSYRYLDKPWMIGSTAQGVTRIDDFGNTGLITIRVYQNNKGKTVPLDVSYPVPQQSCGKGLVTFLDIDHIVQFNNSMSVKPEELGAYGKKLNDVSSKIFFDALTEKALEEWK
ncbi:MAG: TIGR04255 family protein [Spirochaetia bacterium]|jgi:uncharacterized protein (TIGR04255 family)|nr:TIGR04255 family protein [Spirochaetia bacterium]